MQGTALFQYLVSRHADSLNGTVPARYLALMSPAFPDVSAWNGSPARTSVMLNDEWPRIRQDLDSGHPVPLGLIGIISAKISDLDNNNQVLAYGYDLSGFELTLLLYDPNYPHLDDLTLSLNVVDAQRPVSVAYTFGSLTDRYVEVVHCFFSLPYSAKQPPSY